MIYLELLLGFLEVGMFSFGGGYGAIPLIKDVVLSHGWLSDDMLSYMIAVSESTPGPIMVNLATYVGDSQGGILGAAVATVGVVTPAFVVMILIAKLLKNFIGNKYVKAAMSGILPTVMGIILATGAVMVYKNCFVADNAFHIDVINIAITAVLFCLYYGSRHIKIPKKGMSPIMLIVVSAVIGAVAFGIFR